MAVGADLVHHEWFTTSGLLTFLWHGPPDAEAVVLACGGAMGGLLGPAEGFYQWLGEDLAADGVATARVGYRSPNDLAACTIDLLEVGALAARSGARRMATMGHSFGGAVAVQAAVAMGEDCRGVVTFATQSAGCEVADRLGATPLLLFHGDADEILPVQASEMVHYLAGDNADLRVVAGAGHLLSEAGSQLRSAIPGWLRDHLEVG